MSLAKELETYFTDSDTIETVLYLYRDWIEEADKDWTEETLATYLYVRTKVDTPFETALSAVKKSDKITQGAMFLTKSDLLQAISRSMKFNAASLRHLNHNADRRYAYANKLGLAAGELIGSLGRGEERESVIWVATLLRTALALNLEFDWPTGLAFSGMRNPLDTYRELLKEEVEQ